MSHDADGYHRRSIRLYGYDYALGGAYFVTIVTQNRQSFFGEIVDGQTHGNPAYDVVVDVWHSLPSRFADIHLDAVVLMPNHLHGIIVIDDPATIPNPRASATTRVAPTKGYDDMRNSAKIHVGAPFMGARDEYSPDAQEYAGQGAREKKPTLGKIIGAFKSLSTAAYIDGIHAHGWPPFDRRLWQRNYYEHIIRDQIELAGIREYIVENPLKWGSDRENPSRHNGV